MEIIDVCRLAGVINNAVWSGFLAENNLLQTKKLWMDMKAIEKHVMGTLNQSGKISFNCYENCNKNYPIEPSL